MIFSSNNLPEIGEIHDPGILRRILRIRFTQVQKTATPECRPAILAMLVGNAMLWYRDGLLISSEMNLAVKSYIESQDFIAEFIAEHCHYGRDLKIPRKEFLKALQELSEKKTRGLSDRVPIFNF